MTVRMDKAGRIILPKRIRDSYKLREGAELELEERPDGLVLRPVDQQQTLRLEDGLLVFTGKTPRGFDWDKALDDVREDRIKDLSGL